MPDTFQEGSQYSAFEKALYQCGADYMRSDHPGERYEPDSAIYHFFDHLPISLIVAHIVDKLNENGNQIITSK